MQTCHDLVSFELCSRQCNSNNFEMPKYAVVNCKNTSKLVGLSRGNVSYHRPRSAKAMLYTARTLAGMGAPPLPALYSNSRHFPQWSRTAILTLSNQSDELCDVKKASPEPNAGFIVSGADATARVAHLEHSVRFLQEQHRLMLSGLHAEIEALRERNRDLQFQLIFNKDATPKPSSPSITAEEVIENTEEANLRHEVTKLEKEAAAARAEARAAEARALQLQRVVEAQAEKIRELEVRSTCGVPDVEPAAEESRAELRARLADAERLVRRLRGDAERQRREVLAAATGVTNLLFDGAAARHAHLQCMKNSLHASLRASGLDSFGYQNHYAFPPVHTADFWREPLREEYSMGGSRGQRSNRRPITLPELSAVGQSIHRSTVFANPHARMRSFHEKPKKSSTSPSGETANGKSTEEPPEARLSPICTNNITTTGRKIMSPMNTYPELKIVVTKIIPHDKVTSPGTTENGARTRTRRHHHRKHGTDHT